MVARKIAVLLVFLLVCVLISSSAASVTWGEPVPSTYTGVGRGCSVVELLDFTQIQPHSGIYENSWTPASAFPSNYSGGGTLSVAASGVTARIEKPISETFAGGSGWTVGSHCTIGAQGYLRFCSTDPFSYNEYAYKSYAIGGCDPSTVSSILLNWDCNRASAGGIQQIDLPCNSLNLLRGLILEGDQTSVRAADNVYLVIKRVTPFRESPFELQVDFNFNIGSIDKSTLQQMDIIIRLRWTSDPSTSRVVIFKATTGTYTVFSSIIGISDTTYTATQLNPLDYINAAGDVKLELYASSPREPYYDFDSCYIDWLCIRLYSGSTACGNHESLIWVDGGGAVTNSFHGDNAGSESGWHTCTWDLTSRKTFILGNTCQIKFEFAQNAYTTSDFRVDNLILKITFNKAYAIYDKIYDLTGGVVASVDYNGGAITLRGCDFTVNISGTLKSSVAIPTHSFSVTNGSRVTQTIDVPTRVPIGNTYSNYRTYCLLPKDYSLSTVLGPNSAEITTACTSSSWNATRNSIFLSNNVISAHGFGTYRIVCLSPNYVTNVEPLLGDKSLVNNYFTRGERVQLRVNLNGNGNYQVKVFDPTNLLILDKTGSGFGTIWYDFTLGTSAPLGQYLCQVTFENGLEAGFFQSSFYVETNDATLQWTGDINEITVTGTIKNTRTQKTAAPNTKLYAVLIDTCSPSGSSAETSYPYSGNGKPYIKKFTTPRIVENYDCQITISAVVSTPPDVSNAWQIRVQTGLTNNPSGTVTYYYDHVLSTSDSFTYEFRISLTDGSCTFTNSSLIHTGPIVTNGTAWKILYNKRTPAYFEVPLTLIIRSAGNSVADEKIQQLFITPNSGKILSINQWQTDSLGKFSNKLQNPLILTPPSNTTLQLFCLNEAGITLKTPVTTKVWARTLHLDTSTLSITGTQDDVRLKARLFYDKDRGQPYCYAAQGITCRLTVSGTSYTTQTEAAGWVIWPSITLPENASSIIISLAETNDQTHSSPGSSAQWITDERLTYNIQLAAEKTTIRDAKIELSSLLVNPNQTITATFSAKSDSNYVKTHLLCKITYSGTTWASELWINQATSNSTKINFPSPSNAGASYNINGTISCYNHTSTVYRKETFSLSVTGMLIDQLIVTPLDLINIGDTVSINTHAVWAHNNSNIANGQIMVEGFGTATTNSQGWAILTIKKDTSGVNTLKIYGTWAPGGITCKSNTLTKMLTWTALKISQPPTIVYDYTKPESCIIKSQVIWLHNSTSASNAKVFIAELQSLSAFTDSQGWASITVRDNDWSSPIKSFTLNSTTTVKGYCIKCLNVETVSAKLLYAKLVSLSGHRDNAALQLKIYREDDLPGANVNTVITILAKNYNRTTTITSDANGYIVLYDLNLPRNASQISFTIKQAAYMGSDVIINENLLRGKVIVNESTTLKEFKVEPNDFLVNPGQLCYGKFTFRSNATYVKLGLSMTILVDSEEVMRTTIALNPNITLEELLPFNSPRTIGDHRVTFRVSDSLSREIPYVITVTKVVLRVSVDSACCNLNGNVTLTIWTYYAHNNSLIKNAIVDINGTRGNTANEGFVKIKIPQTAIGAYNYVVGLVTSPDDISAHDPQTLRIAWTGMLTHKESVTSDNSTQSVVTISVIWAHNNTPIANALVRSNQLKMENFTDSKGLVRFAVPDTVDFLGNVTFEAVRSPENITYCLEKVTLERRQLEFSVISAQQSQNGLTIAIRCYYDNGSPASGITLRLKVNRLNEPFTATTDKNGIIEIKCPRVYSGPISVQAQSITCANQEVIVDRSRFMRDSLFNDNMVLNEMFTLPTTTLKTGQDLMARVYVHSTCTSISIEDLWLRATLSAENGSSVTIATMPNWPKKLRAGEQVETYLNLTKLQRNLTSGKYILTIAMLCGDNSTVASCGKEVSVKQAFTLTVNVCDEEGRPILGAEVILKRVLPQNRTVESGKAVTDLNGTAYFDAEVGEHLVEVYLNGQRISSKNIGINEAKICPLRIASQNAQVKAPSMMENKPQLVFASIIAVLSSILILALRRRKS